MNPLGRVAGKCHKEIALWPRQVAEWSEEVGRGWQGRELQPQERAHCQLGWLRGNTGAHLLIL